MLEVYGHNAFLVLGVCFATSVLLVWLMRKVAMYLGVYDVPDERKIQKKPVPLLGGVGIFLTFLLGYIFFCKPSDIMSSILISSFLIL